MPQTLTMPQTTSPNAGALAALVGGSAGGFASIALLATQNATVTLNEVLLAASEGRRQEQINIATGEREAFIARSEGEKQAVINRAQGEAESIIAVADATAKAIERIAAAIEQPGGQQAVQLKVAEQAVEAYGKVASDATTTLIVPSNMTEVSALITSAMKMIQLPKA